MLARRIYYLFCLAGLVALGSIRSSPFYGKLDFYFLKEAPWRNPWQPMIEKVLADGTRPIVSDMITETVFRGVFAQSSPGFRFDPRFARIDIEDLVLMQNRAEYHSAPVGALSLLLPGETKEQQARIIDILTRAAVKIVREKEGKKQDRYRCIINLHDYPPSWVPFETGHWSPLWSQPSHIYAFHGKRGKELRQFLKDNPLPGCLVYF